MHHPGVRTRDESRVEKQYDLKQSGEALAPDDFWLDDTLLSSMYSFKINTD
jgi:hypothetical protein